MNWSPGNNPAKAAGKAPNSTACFGGMVLYFMALLIRSALWDPSSGEHNSSITIDDYATKFNFVQDAAVFVVHRLKISSYD